MSLNYKAHSLYHLMKANLHYFTPYDWDIPTVLACARQESSFQRRSVNTDSTDYHDWAGQGKPTPDGSTYDYAGIKGYWEPRGGADFRKKPWRGSYGLMQCGGFTMAKNARGHVYYPYQGKQITSFEQLQDPAVNVNVAYQLYKQFKDFRDFSSFTTGAYKLERKWLGEITPGAYHSYYTIAQKVWREYQADNASNPAPNAVLNGNIKKKPVLSKKTVKDALKKTIDKRKDDVADMRVADKEKVHKQKARNSSILAAASLAVYAWLEGEGKELADLNAVQDAFHQIEAFMGHDWTLNVFSVVIPTFGYWALNKYAFKKSKTGSRIARLLAPALLGVGDKDYKKRKDSALKEIDELEELLDLF